MRNRWWFPFDRMAEFSFSRLPDGWLSPKPWLLGPRQYSVLDEERELRARRKFRRAWRFLFVGIIVVIGVMMPKRYLARARGPFTRLVAAASPG